MHFRASSIGHHLMQAMVLTVSGLCSCKGALFSLMTSLLGLLGLHKLAHQVQYLLVANQSRRGPA